MMVTASKPRLKNSVPQPKPRLANPNLISHFGNTNPVTHIELRIILGVRNLFKDKIENPTASQEKQPNGDRSIKSWQIAGRGAIALLPL